MISYMYYYYIYLVSMLYITITYVSVYELIQYKGKNHIKFKKIIK